MPDPSTELLNLIGRTQEFLAQIASCVEQFAAWRRKRVMDARPALLEFAATPRRIEPSPPLPGYEETLFDKGLAGFLEKYISFMEGIRKFARLHKSAPPSKGYEPWFIGRGDHPLTARFLALMIITVGPKHADENNRQRRMIAGAIRDLGKKGTRRAASVANASATILSLPVAHSLINRIFEEAGHRGLSCEFANLLERAAAAEPFACRRLIEIAKAVAPDIPPPRGRQISVATAMHELFLEMLRSSGKSAAYTWNDDQEDFLDEMTEATRREVGDPDFDPRPARRRMRAKKISRSF